jgi:hypothetical protein
VIDQPERVGAPAAARTASLDRPTGVQRATTTTASQGTVSPSPSAVSD